MAHQPGSSGHPATQPEELMKDTVDETPIFTALVAERGSYPQPIDWTTPAFSIMGSKKRRKLAGDTQRVLREAGLVK
jgi:hypothetical protein